MTWQILFIWYNLNSIIAQQSHRHNTCHGTALAFFLIHININNNSQTLRKYISGPHLSIFKTMFEMKWLFSWLYIYVNVRFNPQFNCKMMPHNFTFYWICLIFSLSYYFDKALSCFSQEDIRVEFINIEQERIFLSGQKTEHCIQYR